MRTFAFWQTTVGKKVVVTSVGGKIAQHCSQQETASIHAIAGNVRLGWPTRTMDLPAGKLLVLAPGLAHDVEAVADSGFLLTLARGAQS